MSPFSSLPLVSLAKGVMTTPQLHYVVRCINTNGRFGQPSEDGYYNKLVSGFNKLLVRNKGLFRTCLALVFIVQCSNQRENKAGRYI